MLSAEVDLSQVDDIGKKTLVVKPKSTMQGLDLQADPRNVTLNIESITTQNVPVEVQLEGEKDEWLYYGEPVLSASTIEVTGARSNVEKVAKAVCRINIDSLEVSTKETRSVVLLDENGNELPSSMFANIPSVIVELPIYPKKTVAIDLRSITETTTGVADGYEITGIKVEPENVQVAGNLQDLEMVSSVKLEPIVLENAEIDQVVNAKVQVPEGLYAVTPAEVQVTLTIKPQQDKRTYPAVDIGVKNLGAGLKAALEPETVDVDASGAKTTSIISPPKT
jgi:YbbR domain-containing protein